MNHADERTEIRILGPMLVRRADGSVVEASEWRTQKTVDLLRLLALSPGRPVAAERILGQLWGDAEAKRARASLRTAMYHIRQVLGDGVVQRRGTGLALEGVWVDADAYESLAEEVDRSHRMETHQNTVAVTRDAEALYLGDLDSQDAPECLDDAANRLRGLRHRTLLAAAEAALAVNWTHDALDLATCALDIDPQSERATRAQMLALAGTGEVEAALAAFERLRQDLAERLGVDPSPQTRALHIALLSGTVSRPAYSIAARHDTATATLVSAVSRIRLCGSGGLVLLRGERGSGRTAVAEAACGELGIRAHRPSHSPGTFSFVLSRALREAPQGTVVLLPARRAVCAAEVQAAALAAQNLGRIVIVPADDIDPDVDAMPAVRGDTGAVVSVPRLAPCELTDLARRLFQGEPSRDLVDTLERASEGLAGVASAVAREWLFAGRVVWTPDGLALATPTTGTALSPTDRVERLLRATDWRAIDVLSVAAVMANGVVAEDVATVLASLRPGCSIEPPAVLDRLTDEGLLAVTTQGYVFRNQNERALVLGWLRPATRRRLHRAIAAIPRLDPVDRTRHLIACGAHQEACDVGVSGLSAACEEGDADNARALIGVLEQLPGRLLADGTDRPLRHHLPEMAGRLRLSWSAVAGAAALALTKGLDAYHRNQGVLVDALGMVG